MQYSGVVYRPPSESGSLIVQCTLGCSHNRCAFCIMYRSKQFSIRPLEDVLADLAEARSLYHSVQRIFLADGDAMILPMRYLMKVLSFIEKYFPECERISTYASAKSLLSKSDAELQQLHENGLSMVYIGLETGNEALLEKYNKGVTVEQIVENTLRAQAAGMTCSVTVINGMGGIDAWKMHAIDTASALSRMKPAYIAFLTLRVYAGTLLYDWIQNGSFTLSDPMALIRETRLFLEHIDSEGSIFRSNHASNYLPLKGTLNADRERLISQIDQALSGEIPLRNAKELGL